MIAPRRKLISLFLREAESPAPIIVGSDVRNCVWLFRQRVKVRLELIESEPAIDGLGITNKVKIVTREVDDAPAAFIFDVRVSRIPFFRNSPIERLRSGWHLVNRETRNELRQISE